MIKGQCQCGKVQYRYAGTINEIAFCHCSQCRLAQGGAFAANSPLDSDKLTLTGQEHIEEFVSSNNKVRAYCRRCGSPLYSARHDRPAVKRLRVGTVLTPVHCESRYHVHVASRASWYHITDNYPQFLEGKPT